MASVISSIPKQRPALFRPIKRGSTSGTLLITEATLISKAAGGMSHVPGIYSDAQIQAWKKITDAVHARGSHIFLQLWAMGRAADINFLEKQDPPSPSKPPRPLTEAEINDYIATFAKAARNAVHAAGFDGVEIHSAYGYLLDQFLQTVSDKRTDKWGGDEEGRTRFVREVVSAVVDAVGEDRVGIRISPWGNHQDMGMPDPRPTFAYLITALRDKHPRMAYLHVPEPCMVGRVDVTSRPDESNDFLRQIWNSGERGEKRVFISAGGYTRETALHTAEDKGGLIAFGQLYITNPDLPLRLWRNLPLAATDPSAYYQPGNLTPRGHNDWSFAHERARL